MIEVTLQSFGYELNRNVMKWVVITLQIEITTQQKAY